MKQVLFFIFCFSHVTASQLDLEKRLPQTTHDIKKLVIETKKQFRDGIQQVVDQKKTRTFDNTIIPIDLIRRRVIETSACLKLLILVHPDSRIRRAARAGFLEVKQLFFDELYTNRAIYDVVKRYSKKISHEQKHYCAELIRLFEQRGIRLSPKKRARVREISRQLTKSITMFETAISQDVPIVHVDRLELAGLSSDFIAALPHKDTEISLRIDRPTYRMVKQFCTVSSTREKVWLAYQNRAYPINKKILDGIVVLRQELAGYLGFASYTECALDYQAGQSLGRAETFLQDLSACAQPKYDHELQLLRARTGLSDGLFKPWDIGHLVKQEIKTEQIAFKRHVREYFPAAPTIRKISELLGQFLGLTFRFDQVSGLWHQNVEHVGVYDQRGLLRGHLLLDLYPRDHKFGRASSIKLVSSAPAVIAIIANFPELLQPADLRTFCHELGHALRAILGATQNGLTDIATETDFHETIAKLFGEWPREPSVLQAVSSHYQTGKPLDAQTAAKICGAQKNWSGRSMQRKIGLSQLCLDCYAVGAPKDQDQLVKNMYDNYLYGLQYDRRAHPLCSFGYLVKGHYGPAYYAYLKANVVACDLFDEIKRRGLHDPKTGQWLIEKILSKSNNYNPEDLIRDFLGREPDLKAFRQRMGF